MQSLQYFIDYNSLPSNSSHNSSTNETLPEYKTYQEYKCPQTCSSFNDFEKSTYNCYNQNILLNIKKKEYKEYPRKVQKNYENQNYENKEIFYNFPAKENSQTFPFSFLQNELNYALFEQEKLFESVLKRSREIGSKIHEINSDISDLKRTFNTMKFPETLHSNNILNQLENMDTKEAYIHKTLKLNDCFKYELALYSDFPNILIRDRLFSFKVVLRNSLTKALVKNNNRIYLAIEVFTADDVPKRIKENKSGKPIIQAEKDSLLINGESLIGRLKINEVSSHFSKGLFNICVFCINKQESPSSQETNLENDAEGSDIKPLVISNIKVKSKK